MTEYRVSLGITTGMSVKATRWIAENAEKMGADGIWIGEDIGHGQDAFVLTAATCVLAHNVRVGTGIVPITTRDLMTIARAAVTLHDLRPGTFVFGTGIGGIQDLQKRGIRIRRPVTFLRTAINVLRKLWEGETVSVESEGIWLKEAALGKREHTTIPVFLGVRGPQMLKLAGEIADGVILSGPREYLRWAMSILDETARRARREPSDIERVVWLPTIPTFSEGSEELARRVVAVVIADTPPQVLDLLTIDRTNLEHVRKIVREKGVAEGAGYINSEMLETFAITGSKETIVDTFERIIHDGATEIVVGPPFSGAWQKATEAIFSEVQKRNCHQGK